MNIATEPRTCPSCGAVIPAKAPQGICPKCLMAAALATDAGQTGGKRPEPPSLERLAAAFPQLDVIEFIGQGGMGAVYKARQKQLDRIVALKVLPPGIGGDPSFAERFTREAKALAKLLHPNIVALFEFGQADGIYYLLMEYVDGVSLGQLLRASRVSAREALAIVPQICDALQYAHDQGIVHRDIKPENILLDRRGRVKVADFGLAKLVGAGAGRAGSPLPAVASQMSDGAHGVTRPTDGLTDAGKIMGTPNYMAPEQVEHPAEVDHRADIYALGVVFYQMLTGELPGKRMEPPSKKVQIDVRLDEVVMRALEKDPGRRYSQASVLKTQVETIATEMEGPNDSRAPARGRDYRTRQTLFGLPLVHVVWGIDPATGRPRVAKGILAVGPAAFGVIAVGFSAWGLFPCGLIAGGFWPVGLFAVGFGAVGLAAAGFQAVGLLVVAFWHAVGLVAAGPSPIGLEKIVVGKGMVGILFVLATLTAWLMDRLIRAIGSATALPATVVVKSRQSWWTWSPLQSQEVGGICTHLTKAERNHLSVLGLLSSAWIVGTGFGIPAFIRSNSGPGKWIVALVWMILFAVSIPMLQRMVRHFLCSTGWARERGFAPEHLRLFSFSGGNLWKVCAFLALGFGLVFAQSKLFTHLSGISELSASLKENAARTTELSSRLAARAKSLQGTWSSPDIEASGTGWSSLVIHGSTLDFHSKDTNYWFKASFSIREDTNPKQLIAVITEGPDPQDVGKTANAIYQIQDGTLIIAVNEPGDPAVPASFDAPGADKFVFKQQANRPLAPSLAPGAGRLEGGFGPVVERVIPESAKGVPSVLDFESGNLLIPPNDLAEVLKRGERNVGEEALDWLQASGGDAVAIMPEATSVRLFQTTATKAAINLRDLPWADVTAEQVIAFLSKTSAQRAEAGVSHVLFSTDASPSPVAMLFVTREGTMGVLEVLGPSYNPRGVKIRYKLVQTSRNSLPEGAGKPEAQPANRMVLQAAEPMSSVASTATTFSVTAAGTAPLAYQWWHGPTNSAELSPATTGSAASHGLPFVARLAQGEVELLALSHHPSTNQTWWRPDGTPWTNVVFHNPSTSSSPTKGQRFEFVFQRRGLPPDTTLECSFEPGTGEVSMGSRPWRQGKELPDHNVIETVLTESAKEVTIRLGVAAGEWKTMLARTPQAGAGSSFTLGDQTCRALFLDPVESSGEARVGVSYNKVPGWTTRVTALDTKGQLHVSFPYENSIDDVASAEGRFPGLPLSRVKQFRFEARPFTGVEFRNVSLQPGEHTQVEVVNVGDK